jgi:hypothetical protein
MNAMKIRCINSVRGLILLTVWFLTLCSVRSVPAAALDVSWGGDTLSVKADQVPLQDILGRLQESGITIRVDPRVNPSVTLHFENRDIRDGIEDLLAGCDYALFSTLIEGPAGSFRHISEINVYMRGDRRALQPLPGKNDNLVRAQAPVHTNVLTCVKDEVLLRLKKNISLPEFRALLARLNGTVVESLPALGIYRIRLAPGSDLAALLKTLGSDPMVERAEPNLVYQPVTPQRVAAAAAVPRGSTAPAKGAAAVAVLDTGLRADAGLGDRVLASLDALAPDRPMADGAGHGTQMALIAAGMTVPEGGEATANAVGVPIIPIRAFDDNGYAAGFALMRSLAFALDQGARVVSMSWGSETDSGFLNDAMAYAAARGAVLVAAAGNEPTGRPMYPAANPNVVAVAALSPDGSVWSQSNYGSFVELAAPAFATFPVGYKGPPGTYAGTSVATAFTANALARYFALHPEASARQALDALKGALSREGSASTRTHAEIGRLDSRAMAFFLGSKP